MTGATIAKGADRDRRESGRDRHAFIERTTSVRLTTSPAPSGQGVDEVQRYRQFLVLLVARQLRLQDDVA
jgi:hypothetical protein